MNFEDAQEEILYRYRVYIAADRQSCTIPLRPAAKMEQRRFQLFDLLQQPAALLPLLLARCARPIRDIQIERIETGVSLPTIRSRVSLFMQKIGHLLRRVRREANRGTAFCMDNKGMRLERDTLISAEPRAFWLIFNGKISCEQGGARAADNLNTPPLRRNRRYAHPELAALLPPAGYILQARLPDRQRSSAGRREQHAKRLLAKQAAFWMEIEGIQSSEIIDTLHDLTPDASYLVGIHTQTIKKHFIIRDRGWDAQ